MLEPVTDVPSKKESVHTNIGDSAMLQNSRACAISNGQRPDRGLALATGRT